MAYILQRAGTAFRQNIKPALFLWTLMVLFAVGYFGCEAMRQWLQILADFKVRTGLLYPVVSFAFFGGIMPELLKVIFAKPIHFTHENAYRMTASALIFGSCSIGNELLYRGQALWFGETDSMLILLKKVGVDQLLWTPCINAFMLMLTGVAYARFSKASFRRITVRTFWTEQYLPVMVAGWSIWFPGTLLLYTLPLPLQLPVASFIICFWSIILAFMAVPEAEKK